MDNNQFIQKSNELFSKITSNLVLVEVKGDSVQHLFASRLLFNELVELCSEYSKGKTESEEDVLNKEV